MMILKSKTYAKHPWMVHRKYRISSFANKIMKRSNERIFFEAQSNSQTQAASSKNLNRFLDHTVYETRQCTSPEMLQKQTHKKHFRQSERSIQKTVEVEHPKTDVKEAKHFCLISLSFSVAVMVVLYGKNMRFIIYNPWAWRIMCTVKNNVVVWKL